MPPKSKKHRGTSEIVTAQASTKSHRTHSTPKDNTKAHIGQGQDTDSSDDVLNHLEPSSDLPDSCLETIDLTRPVQFHNLSLTLMSQTLLNGIQKMTLVEHMMIGQMS